MKSKNKNGVSHAKSTPLPKGWGIISKTKEWREATSEIGMGKSIEIRLPDHLNGSLRSPINAFMAALKRKYRKTYRIYALKGIVYCVPKQG
jgi:hypothetical protein